MLSWIRNIAAVVAGALIGGFVNMRIIIYGPLLIAPPPGADVTTAEGLQRSIHLFQPQHFVMPFWAHALGTLVGAFVAAALAAANPLRAAFIVGVLFLAGGIMAVRMIPAPLWFDAIDLLFAYLPMAWAGAKLAGLLPTAKK